MAHSGTTCVSLREKSFVDERDMDLILEINILARS
jgi:hypothetical protein